MNDNQPTLPTRSVIRESWQQIIKDWRQSGLTAKQFCQDRQIKEADLRRWNYRLNKKQRKSGIKDFSPHSSANQFIPVTVSQAKAEENGFSGIEMVMGAPKTLRLNKPFDEETLLRLLAVLRRAEGC